MSSQSSSSTSLIPSGSESNTNSPTSAVIPSTEGSPASSTPQEASSTSSSSASLSSTSSSPTVSSSSPNQTSLSSRSTTLRPTTSTAPPSTTSRMSTTTTNDPVNTDTSESSTADTSTSSADSTTSTSERLTSTTSTEPASSPPASSSSESTSTTRSSSSSPSPSSSFFASSISRSSSLLASSTYRSSTTDNPPVTPTTSTTSTTTSDTTPNTPTSSSDNNLPSTSDSPLTNTSAPSDPTSSSSGPQPAQSSTPGPGPTTQSSSPSSKPQSSPSGASSGSGNGGSTNLSPGGSTTLSPGASVTTSSPTSFSVSVPSNGLSFSFTNSNGDLTGSASLPSSIYTDWTTTLTNGQLVTVTSLISNPSGGLQGGSGGSNSFLKKTGAVAGVFTVVGLACAAMIAALVLGFIRRRRRRQVYPADQDFAASVAGISSARRPLDDELSDDGQRSFVGIGNYHDDDPFVSPPRSYDGHEMQQMRGLATSPFLYDPAVRGEDMEAGPSSSGIHPASAGQRPTSEFDPYFAFGVADHRVQRDSNVNGSGIAYGGERPFLHDTPMGSGGTIASATANDPAHAHKRSTSNSSDASQYPNSPASPSPLMGLGGKSPPPGYENEDGSNAPLPILHRYHDPEVESQTTQSVYSQNLDVPYEDEDVSDHGVFEGPRSTAIVDSRLNPAALDAHRYDSGASGSGHSSTSVVGSGTGVPERPGLFKQQSQLSFNDGQDYSRPVLAVTNVPQK